MTKFRNEVLSEGVRLICGDCMEVLPTLGRIDCVITDPPYGVGFKGQTENDGRKSRGGYEAFADDDPIYIIDRVKAALEISDRAAITPGIRLLPLYPPFDDLGCFFVPSGVGLGKWGFCCFHPIAYYGKRPKRPGMWPTSFSDVSAMPSDYNHPVAKPIKWMERLVRLASERHEIILDPFMGSGTTGVAAVKKGKAFYGIEREPKYFDIACRRIEDALRRPDLFIPAPAPKAKQEQLI